MKPNSIDLDFKVSRPQKCFIDSDADFILYGGQAGGGKTHVQVVDAYLMALQYAGIKQLILRRTFPELKRSIILKSQELFDRRICTYNESDHVWRFTNGSRIEFGYCERDSDVGQYQSAEYDVIRLDESTHFTEYIIQYLKSRIRGANAFPKQMKLGTNPGGASHTFHYEKFVRDRVPYKVYEENGEKSVFIPAKIDDNVFLLKNDPDYKKRLEQLPEKDRKMLLEGDWECFEGRYFTEFKPNTFREEPFILPENAMLYGSLDHGTTAPTSFGLWWRDSNKIPHRLLTYYKGNKTTSEHAAAAAAMCAVFTYTHGQPPRFIYADPSMWTKTRMSESYQPAPIDFWEEAFKSAFATFTLYKPEFVRANNDIRSGCAIMREFLREVDGEPRMRYWARFNGAFEQYIPQQQHDPHDSEIYDTTLEDHVADDTRYALVGMYSSTLPTTTDSVKKRVTIDSFKNNRYIDSMKDIGMR